MTVRTAAGAVLVDGRPATGVPADDRGLAYGDGLFETIAFHGGRAPLWPGHMARLRRGCRRLGLAPPEPALLWSEAAGLAGPGDVLIKLIVSRGSGRGYAPPARTATRRVLLRQALPILPARLYRDGLRLRWCRLRLAIQPALAGLKHLGRLEQVLARAEWRDPAIDEGLCLDADGHVVCATAANVFIVRDGMLLTPQLDRCGVAGVARAALLARARRWLPVREQRLVRADVDAADEVFLSNAVRGVMPVRMIGRRRYRPGPVAARLGYTLAAVGIGQAFDEPS
jgi:4-amino-4-deoxychorismate lyase